MSFYLQCASGASMDIFEGNVISEYTVHLPTAIELTNDYEVGLCEIQYPNSWDNIRRGKNKIIFKAIVGGKDELTSETEVPAGYYKSIDALVKTLQGIINVRGSRGKSKNTTYLAGLKVRYDSMRKCVRFDARRFAQRGNERGEIITKNVSLTLTGDVSRLCGFNNNVVIKAGSITESAFPATVSGGFHQMYVYCDIIHPQPHPDGEVNILRTIAVSGEAKHEYISKQYKNIYYIPVAKNIITNISFKILDNTGERIGFNFGKALIYLHFQPRVNMN